MILEICVGSLEDARTAAHHRANRLELCGALELGGLTPSLGLVEQVICEVNLPVIVMIRPRAGGFHYSSDEFQAMLRDAELALTAGASGIVFGTLHKDATIACDQVAELTQLAGERNTVFHRAFDFTMNKQASLETLIDLGVTRVLTTGGRATAAEGMNLLCQLIEQASGRIEILPCGNIDATNVTEIANATSCTQIHAGSSKSISDSSLLPTEAASLCDQQRVAQGTRRGVDGNMVAAIKSAIAG